MIELDVNLEVEEEWVPPLVQTRAIGCKQSVVRWLPGSTSDGGVYALAGTWDEGKRNEVKDEVAVWGVRFAAGDDDMSDAHQPEQPQPKRLATAPHRGCVLGMAIRASESGGSSVAFAASGDGGISAYSVSKGDTPTLRQLWAEDPAVHKEVATPSVAWGEAAGRLAACGEDGSLRLLDASGVEVGSLVSSWDAPMTPESFLFGLNWQAPNQLISCGNLVQVWDVRASQTCKGPTLQLDPLGV